MIDIIYTALPMRAHAKMTGANLYMYIEVGARPYPARAYTTLVVLVRRVFTVFVTNSKLSPGLPLG